MIACYGSPLPATIVGPDFVWAHTTFTLPDVVRPLRTTILRSLNFVRFIVVISPDFVLLPLPVVVTRLRYHYGRLPRFVVR